LVVITLAEGVAPVVELCTVTAPFWVVEAPVKTTGRRAPSGDAPLEVWAKVGVTVMLVWVDGHMAHQTSHVPPRAPIEVVLLWAPAIRAHARCTARLSVIDATDWVLAESPSTDISTTITAPAGGLKVLDVAVVALAQVLAAGVDASMARVIVPSERRFSHLVRR
jgi:hypothetical protein